MNLEPKVGRPASPVLRHIISVDVEDYFQVEAFADRISRDSWDTWPSRVVTNTYKVLDLFDRYEVRGTFFFLGWVAIRFPSLVREVAARGHELACHSFWHRPIYSLSPAQFREDTRMARDAIQQPSGARLLGYRAPTWSITSKSLWALDVLAEEGFVYDSSIYPINHDLCGIPKARRFPYVHRCSNGRSLCEFPPTTVRLAGVNFPGAGGGYLRVFPFAYTRWIFRHIPRKHGQPLVVYFHPWELDPDQPRIRHKLRSHFRHYTNLRRMESRIEHLLRNHRFQPFQEFLSANNTRQPEAGKLENRSAAPRSVVVPMADARPQAGAACTAANGSQL